MNKLRIEFVQFLKSITIEPVIFLYSFGMCVTGGAQVTTNLLIWKFCSMELNYTDDVCRNLTSANNSDIEKAKNILILG